MDLTSLTGVLDDWQSSSTVVLDVTTTDEAGAHERDLRWRDLRRRLEAQGASENDLAVLDQALQQPVDGAGALTRFTAVRDGRVVLDDVLFEGSPDGIGSATVAPVVDLMPLLRYRARHAPAVVVHADREGADIEVVTAAGGPAQDRSSTHGSTEHIHKVQVGGWRHSHYQRVSENVWRGNAEEAAAEARRLLRENGAAVVLLSGDVRARQLIAEALADLPVVQVEGDTRADGADTSEVDLTLARVLDERDARDEDEAVQRWRALHEDDATRSRTTQDLQSTVTAARQGQIEELLLVPSVLRSRQLVIGPAGTDVALPGAPVPWDGETRRAPADLALLRAAAVTGAQLQLVELESQVLPDGVAARLRWATDETPGQSTEVS